MIIPKERNNNKMPIFKYYNPFYKNPYYRYRPVSSPYYYPNYVQEPPVPPKPAQNKPSISPQKEENAWLDLFGIKLYFDDVLILSLLFFLYKEEVKDEGLFLALVLLLIS